MARGTRLALFCTTLTLVSAAPAGAVSSPPAGAYKYKWKTHRCDVSTDRSIASIRTEVLGVPSFGKRYYQEVTIQIDRLGGFGPASNTWRKVDSRNYDWSRFTAASLPTYSTSSIRTGLQPSTGQLSAKATVTLRQVRNGPDKKVWQYKVRSPTFTCYADVTMGQ
jgi:hypothetical protein